MFGNVGCKIIGMCIHRISAFCWWLINITYISTFWQCFRWKNVCGLSADKKHRILTVWTLLEEVLRLSQEQQQWLESQEQILKDMDSRRGQMSQEEIQDLISKVEVGMYSFLTF
jgi:hypothetical protein